ncbi:G2/M phase-specific E3 ubiquitin-protein ligase-like [Siphateles boraxobius]|uniref:G2/M phase-specific E3 ubiquitin-protein ligase-like n=1 Tax=Siphateles boraxobius TaxID=180520 RepID=UPI004062ED00
MDHQRQLANAGQSQAEYPDVVSAAQSFISALTQTLNQSPVTPRSQVQGQQTAVQEQRQTNSTIDQEMASLDDLLKLLASRVNSENQFRICVSRDNLLERGLKQWQRQKKGNPVDQLKVTFIGEAGIDSGALRKEFLTEMINGIEKRLFLGQRAKSPQYSNSDLDNGLFRTAGEIFAVSLAQGGPAPCFLKEWCFFYLTNEEIDVHRICKDDVDDIEFSLLISKVEEATDLNELMDEIISCGYTGICNTDHKDAIIRAIVLHATFRVAPMLGDLRKGLQLYGLLDILKEHPNLCKSLFVPGEDCTPDADYVLSHVAPEMSLRGTSRATVESKIINYFQDFLQEIESGDAADVETEPSHLTVPRVMQWITGQGHKPLLLSEQNAFQIIFKFDHDCQERMPQHTICYPIVSACTQTITFPVAHMTTYENFRQVIVQAIKSGEEFSRV